MDRLLSYVRRNPAMAGIIGVLVVGVVYLLLTGGAQPPTGGSAVVGSAPSPVPAPAPAAASPGPGGGVMPPPPTPAAVPPPPPPQAAGRADPFAPLVKPQTAPAAAPVRPAPVPPPAPLPPPLFPSPEPPAAPGSPPAPAPEAPTAPPSPQRLAAGAELVGVLGDGGGVAIIRVSNRTWIVSVGELIEDRVRVIKIDATNGVVILQEDGENFELRAEEVNPPYVAHSLVRGS